MISVVVPVYNSEATLPALVERLLTSAKEWGQPFEIILVNDGSRDESWQRILRLKEGSESVRGIDRYRKCVSSFSHPAPRDLCFCGGAVRQH